MKSVKSLLLLIYFISWQAWALNAEFMTSKEDLIEGDITDGVIRLWPVEQADTISLNSLKGKLLFGGLQLISISQIVPSENNADVLEVKGTYVVRSSKISSRQKINYDNEIVEVIWKQATVSELKEKSNEFIIFNQSTDSKSMFLVGVTAIIALIICFLVFKKLAPRFRQKKQEGYTASHFNNIFQSASTREDFERIYALKEKWIPLLHGVTPAHRDFFKTINQHQYKKRWDNDELLETRTSFDPIRRSFSK